MTRDVETIGEDAELSEAVDRMIRRRVKRLPVLRGETLVGVIARSDLLKGLLAATPWATGPHPDAEIKAAVQAELDKLDWAPRASVRVEVQSGVVTFDGAITDERLREGLKVIAENTPGCVGVHDHMAWIEPNSGFFMPSPEDEEKSS
jgi:CBS-domain-containing membrane protein